MTMDDAHDGDELTWAKPKPVLQPLPDAYYPPPSIVFQRPGPVWDATNPAHLWIVTAAWRVDPSKTIVEGGGLLDQENMISVEGPGCWHCETYWRPELADTECPGPA